MTNNWLLFELWLGSLILVFLAARYWPHWRIRRWRRQLQLPGHAAVFQQLYLPVDGFALSKAARKEKDDLSYVYGEIEFEPFIALLSLVRPNQNTRFIDLGSGTGKAVLAAMMVFDLQESTGIERFANLHQAACERRDLLIQNPRYQHLRDKIQFIHADFLQANLAEATLIFVNATAFFGPLWQEISQKLDTLANCQTIISTSKPLNCENYSLLRHTRVEMSWGSVEAFIHQRLS